MSCSICENPAGRNERKMLFVKGRLAVDWRVPIYLPVLFFIYFFFRTRGICMSIFFHRWNERNIVVTCFVFVSGVLIRIIFIFIYLFILFYFIFLEVGGMGWIVGVLGVIVKDQRL